MLRTRERSGAAQVAGGNEPMEVGRKTKESWVATIKASCPTCGDVELTTGDLQVLVCAGTNQGSYAFRCPDCRLAVSKPAEAHVVDVLVASGVRLSVWQLPAELEEPHTGAPISYDDLLAFHFELQRDDWFERLASS
jgi:hypothetical protein